MRAGVTVLGIVFLVLGAILYYMPVASTSATGAIEGQHKSFFASIAIPLQFTIALIIIGAILVLIGLLMPDPQPRIYVENYPQQSYRSEEVSERRYKRARH